MEGKFYVFFAQGKSNVGIMMDVGGGFEQYWRNTLMGQYPGADKMEFIVIEKDQWTYPPVGEVKEGGKNIDFQPYYAAIRQHLTDKLGCSPREAEQAVAATKSNNIIMASWIENKLTFGVPVTPVQEHSDTADASADGQTPAPKKRGLFNRSKK